MEVRFYELAVGAWFAFRGERFEKVAMSMARAEDWTGCVFRGETQVSPEGDAALLPVQVAAQGRPSERHWTEDLGPAPGQGRGRGVRAED